MNSPREHAAAMVQLEPLARRIAEALKAELEAHKIHEAATAKVQQMRHEFAQIAAQPGMFYPISAAVRKALSEIGIESHPGWIGKQNAT